MFEELNLEELKEKAKELGMSFHPKTGEDKLRKALEKFISEPEEVEADNTPVAVVPKAVAELATSIKVQTATEFKEECKAKGLTSTGHKKGTVLNLDPLRLRVYINAGKRPSEVMEIHGINADQLERVVRQLSKSEERPENEMISFYEEADKWGVK